MELKGKTFVITGGGSGLGRQLTLSLVKAGAQVAAVDINLAGLQETVRLAGEIAEDGAERVHVLECNITDAKAVADLPKRVLARYQQIDGLINNAGIIQPFVTVEEMEDQLIDRIFNINFFGTLHMVRAFLPYLRQSDEACLANVSSLGGFVPVSGQTMYGASKAAVKQLTDGLRGELDGTHVHVMSIIPGAMATAIRQNSGLGAVNVEKQKTKAALNPEIAAKLIVEAIQKDKAELYIGKDSRMMHFLFRFIPLKATKWLNDNIRHQHEVMATKAKEL